MKKLIIDEGMDSVVLQESRTLTIGSSPTVSIELDYPISSTAPLQRYYCLSLLLGVFLLVEQLDEQGHTFRRVGCALHLHDAFFDNIEEREVVLV